jgi:3-methylfumaryl-CoA hydratase
MTAAPAGGWEPVVEEGVDLITPATAAALHGLLDAPGPPPGAGDPLPPLWHWLAFLPRTPQRDLGDDGHPRPGSFMPPAEGRRMFAGGHLVLDGGLRVGAELRRRSEVTAVEQKEGRSGRLQFVTVTHQLHPAQSGGPAVTDVQDIVYRPPAPPAAAGAASAPDPTADAGRWDWGFELRPDPTLLFRFSALTYNAHRIHYDRTYATEVEGYPGLVVHGPLQAIALAELCRRNLPDRPLRSFRFRALRPAFDGRPLQVVGRADGEDRIALAVVDDAGSTTMQADATC